MFNRPTFSAVFFILLIFPTSFAFFEHGNHYNYDYGDDDLIFDEAEIAKQRQVGMAKMANRFWRIRLQ